MSVCSCSSPDCRRNGCALQRVPLAPAWPTYQTPPATDPGGIGFREFRQILTEEDVRRIVREEIERAAKDRP